MYPRYLREHIFTYNRFIGGYGNTGIRFNHPADFIQTTFVNVSDSIEMIFQNSLHTGQRCITGTFAQTVDRSMKSLRTTQHGSQHIAHCQVVVIMRMEIEVSMRIALHHLPHIFDDLQRIQHTQCIRQHIPFDIRVHQCIHHLEDILRRIFHPVAPVFQINIHLHILLIGIIHYANNILDMFFRGLSQLTCAMLQRTFAQKINDAAAGSMYPVYRRMPVYETQHLHPGQ